MGYTATPNDMGPNFEPIRNSMEESNMVTEPQDRNIPNP